MMRHAMQRALVLASFSRFVAHIQENRRLHRLKNFVRKSESPLLVFRLSVAMDVVRCGGQSAVISYVVDERPDDRHQLGIRLQPLLCTRFRRLLPKKEAQSCLVHVTQLRLILQLHSLAHFLLQLYCVFRKILRTV